MRIFVPYTKIQPLTKYLLREYEYTPIEMDDGDKYPKYWQERWNLREDFINIEHDVVFWDGSVDEIGSCTAMWCAFGRQAAENITDGAVATFCMAKFTSKLMDKLPNVWNEYLKSDDPSWKRCDSWLDSYARKLGITAHQHYPPIINANPKQIML